MNIKVECKSIKTTVYNSKKQGQKIQMIHIHNKSSKRIKLTTKEQSKIQCLIFRLKKLNTKIHSQEKWS